MLNMLVLYSLNKIIVDTNICSSYHEFLFMFNFLHRHTSKRHSVLYTIGGASEAILNRENIV